MENVKVKRWIARATELLASSMKPVKHELNELDWKDGISPDKKRLTEHLSAFANTPGGGYLVFGIDRSGTPVGVNAGIVDTIVNQLANLGRQALEPPVQLDHTVQDYDSVPLLFVFIAESPVKPVHLRSKGIESAWIRSGGTTRTASRPDIGNLMLNSRTPRWEELRASILLSDSEFVTKLNIEPICKMLKTPTPSTPEEILAWMQGERFIEREPSGGGYITNLGAIAASRSLANFPDLSRKPRA